MNKKTFSTEMCLCTFQYSREFFFLTIRQTQNVSARWQGLLEGPWCCLWGPDAQVSCDEKTGIHAEAGVSEKEKDFQETEVAEDTVQLGLLTSGTAWSIGLSSRDSSTKQLISAACDLWGGSDSYPSLIYRYLVLSPLPQPPVFIC
jgi:hypothetical protein